MDGRPTMVANQDPGRLALKEEVKTRRWMEGGHPVLQPACVSINSVVGGLIRAGGKCLSGRGSRATVAYKPDEPGEGRQKAASQA